MASELLASLEDINTHLPSDKARMKDSDDDALQIDVFRYVRALLAGFFPVTTLSAWNTPDNTPEIIRGVAGRIIAAKWYATLYSEDIEGASEYAQALYKEANMMIDGIRNGTLIVLDANGDPIATDTEAIGLDRAMFLPNSSTPGPYITMDKVFG